MFSEWSKNITAFMKVFDYLKNPSRFKVAYLLFGVILSISQVYYSYRYIFQFGSETTSQTYNTTPASFEVAKYLIFAVFYLVMFVLLLPDIKQIYLEKIAP